MRIGAIYILFKLPLLLLLSPAICEDPEIKERIITLRTEQQTKRQNEGRKRPSRTHSTNSRTQSIRRTSQRDKGLTSKRDAADEAQMLRAREELNKVILHIKLEKQLNKI